MVTQPARGTGVGRALIGALMRWFASQRVETAFLHYLADNSLSSRFWTAPASYLTSRSTQRSAGPTTRSGLWRMSN